ncbi:Histidinol-phosphate aminotransferase [Maioricimonas rarisocia]|uniref:Histidinol-phosphate aminotransferase n=1 Tax=Maioricimonas rarisocia TaxID=2528026 RepID=A0A517ZFX3_9PLAN|nr:histidinol-phosphate transaminase [Maioricimonas rarisocia]QDU41364.1 Histidinol-phosphate aminotransferase [Maioricimonas rarisocia]
MSLFRPDVERIAGYVPGEQPQVDGWTKLNTNENPYPPSPRVVSAIRQAAEGRLNVYPDPVGTGVRKAVAELFGLDPDWVLPTNGSDEALTILLRSFVDPRELISYPYPSYILYETLADLQGARHERMLLNPDWTWNLDAARPLVEQSKLVFVPNPNSPSGTRWSDETLLKLIPPRGVFVLDEAYGDFADEPHQMQLLHTDAGRQIVVTRSLSKSYSLAGLRFGFSIAHPDLIAGMRKVKDSYNCDMISLAAAEAAIRDQEWMRANRDRIVATRQRLATALADLGFDVEPSQANFVWTTHSSGEHRDIYTRLKERKILVRLMTFPEAIGGKTVEGLRITVGTDDQIDRLLEVLGEIL